MKEIKIVGGSYSKDIVFRVPHWVKDLSGVVKVFNGYFVSSLLCSRYDSFISQYLTQSIHVPGCFVGVTLV